MQTQTQTQLHYIRERPWRVGAGSAGRVCAGHTTRLRSTALGCAGPSRDDFLIGRAPLRDCWAGAADATKRRTRGCCNNAKAVNCTRQPSCTLLHLSSPAASRRLRCIHRGLAAGDFALAPISSNVAPHPCADPFPPASFEQRTTPSSANVAASAQHHPILSLSLLRATPTRCLSVFSLAGALPSTDWYAAPRPPVSLHFSRFWLVSHPHIIWDRGRPFASGIGTLC